MQAVEFSRRLTIRTVLVLGFGLTLGLWLFSGYSFTRRITELQRDAARVTNRYVRAQARMSAVRNQVLLASVYVRDALLDPDPVSIVGYRLKLDQSFQTISRAIGSYEPVLPQSPDRRRVDELRHQIEEFRTNIFDVLDSDSTRWSSQALRLLRERIMPKREEALQVSEDVQALNRKAYIDQQAAMSAIYRKTQQRIWTEFGLAVVGSFLIGLVAIRRVTTLEHELRQRQERDARTNADLQRLSAQLLSAQEDERRTIARELHDEVGQALTAIKVELAVAERGAHPLPAGHTSLATARHLTDGALQTVRDLSRLLHPSVLDDIGLAAAVEAYIRDFRKRYDMPVEFTAPEIDLRLPPNAEAAAYRIVQEALTNVVRHASAGSCAVTIRRSGDRIEISVDDDGVGFDPQAQQSGRVEHGLGLLGMRERVKELNGRCVIDSAHNHGTHVLVSLPLAPNRSAAPSRRRDSVLGLLADV